jgi:hypothetical protein
MSSPSTQDLPRGRFDQPVQQAYQSGFAGTGQTHDDENFAFVDIEAGIHDPDALARAFEDLCLVHALFQ